MTERSRQFTLPFNTLSAFSREDFMPARCNFEALRMVESWPQWPFFALSIYGPQGCGKTHLAHIFAQRVQREYQKPIHVSLLDAGAVNMRRVERIYKENPCLVIENLTPRVDQEALFHLFNMYQNNGGYVLFTAREAPARMHFKLPDLRSRLTLVPAISISEPDDDLLTMLIVKLFTDRQINISPEILNFIVQNMQRSFGYARALVTEIDAISLARHRAVSIQIVKEALMVLNTNIQQELF